MGSDSASPAGLSLRRDGGWLCVTLDRPEKRNAMSLAMVEALIGVFDDIARDRTVRAVVLRGAGGHFCAGGDISDMQRAAAASTPDEDAVAALNRRFGHMLQAVDSAGAAVVAVCEGAVMGGGFGLAAVADVTLAVEGARFRLPETSLGITPAQIAPFLVRRLGLSQARRLAVTGETLGAAEAVTLALAHQRLADPADVSTTVSRLLKRVLRCEPHAVAATKALMLRTAEAPLDAVLDEAAVGFAALARSERAQAGFTAFLTRKPAPWVPEGAG